MVGCRDAVLKIWSNLSINVVIIWDQDTGWMCGEMIIKEEKRSLAAHISTFILRTFTSYGFVNLELSGFQPSLFQAVNTYFRELHGLLCDRVPELQGTESGLRFSADHLTTPLDEEMEKLVAKDLDVAVEDLTIRASLSDLEVILAAYRFRREDGSSPFQNIFGWDGREKVWEERRVLKSALLHCKHCHLSFTSKISFRIHQRIHLKVSRRRGELEGQLNSKLKLESGEENEEDILPKNRKRSRKARLKQERLDLLATKLRKHKEIVSTKENEEAKGELLADTVHNLLRVTSAERARRGQYMNLSQDSRDEIAEFALQYGFQAAANHFSSTLNKEVSTDAVRGIVKMYQLYRPELRKQMGEYAELHGLDVAAKYYSQLLGREVRRSTMKRFRGQFGRRRPELETDGKIDSTALRQEIGRYAAEHSVEAAVSVYSQKLQTSVKPATVRKLRRLYGNNAPVSSDTWTTIDLLHSSVNVLNQSGAGYYTIPYAALPLDQPQQVDHADGGGEEMVTLHAVDGNQLQGEVVGIQHSGRLVESLNGGIFSASDESSTATTSNFVQKQNDVIVAMVQVDNEQGRSQDLSLKPPKLEANEEFLKSANNENKKDKELKSTKFERGRYVQYTSQERAQIGAFAAKHGNKAAILHFEEQLGRSIPESTIRVMKDKYTAMVRMSGSQISEVGCGSRGRPTCLGKHDQTLMDTLHRLAKRGEKLNTFAVIAAAKQILSEREVDRDWRFATETKLTTNWAKSILKRINKQK